MQEKNKAAEIADPTPTKPGIDGAQSSKLSASSQIVTAESVQSEEIPTIPLGSFQTVSALRPEVAVRSVATSKAIQLPAPLVAQPSEYRRSLGEWLGIWWEGMRPAYVGLALLPALLGIMLAWTPTITAQTPFGHLRILHLIVMLVALAALQFGANVVNDYYDYIKGIDTSNAVGPGGLIQQGLIKPSRVLMVGFVLLGIGALLGIVLVASGNPVLYILGLLGLLSAYFFSATKHALSSLLLGEVVCFLIYGPFIMLGAYLMLAGTISHADLMKLLIYSLPVGLLAVAVVHVNNMRDMESDNDAGKYTPASLLGLRFSRVFYVLLILGAYAIIAALGIPHHTPHLILITFWTLPTLVVVLTGIARADLPTSLHIELRETLKLHTFFLILLIVALLATAFIPVLPHLPSHLLPF